ARSASKKSSARRIMRCTSRSEASGNSARLQSRGRLSTMQSIARFVFVVALVAGLSASGLVAQGVSVTGEWAFSVQTDQGAGTPTITFKQDGEKLTGKYDGQLGQSDLTGT